MDDATAVALGITAIVATGQETLPFDGILNSTGWRIVRAGLALSAPFLISRGRPWQRAVVTGLGIWGATELLQLGYSTLMLGADTLLVNLTQRRGRGRGI